MTEHSASDTLVSQVGGPIYPVDFQRAAQGVDLSTFELDSAKDAGYNIDIAGSITDGTIERSISEASTLTITLHDPRRAIMGSEIWDYTVDVELDGNWFRLKQFQKSGDDMILLFEDRIVSWLRLHKKALKISRNKLTRAEFIKLMVDEIKEDNKLGVDISFRTPELKKRLPIAKAKTEKKRRSDKDPGLHRDIDVKVKGKAATKKQKALIEAVLDVGIHDKVNDLLLRCAIMVITQESGVTTEATNGTHVGLFQQNNQPGSIWRQLGGATRDPTKDAKAFFHQLEAVYKSAPMSTSAAGYCEMVQVSGQGSLYAQWEDEARATVKEYNGGSGGEAVEDSTYERTYARQFQFTRGQPDGPKNENSWQAGQRLADQVRKRLFVVGNTVYYYDDNQLLKAKPIMVIDEDSEGITSIDFDCDEDKATNEATIICRAERWLAHPGEVVTLQDTMGKAKGRWLVQNISRPLFSEDTTITLYRPIDPLKEPAPELNTVTKERRNKANKKGDGHVVIAPGANRPGKAISPWVIDFLESAAGQTSEEIKINFGTNHNQYSTSGNVSDHWDGNAADINVGGDARSSAAALSKGINIATALLVTLGVDHKTAHQWASTDGLLNFSSPASVHQYKGYRIQIGWRTLVGGDHYNHVHFGMRP